MQIVLIRHGETEEGSKNIILGHLHGNLNKKGKEQSEKISQKLKHNNLTPEVIFTSNLKRACDTANIICKKLNTDCAKNDLLNERGAGVAEGKTEKEIDWDEYEKNPIESRKHESGESFTDVKKRANDFLAFLAKQNYQEIVIVSHSVFLLMFLSLFTGKDIKEALRENVDFREKIPVLDLKKRAVLRLLS